jgi:F0F1-type ATP synthase assembly protein I
VDGAPVGRARPARSYRRLLALMVLVAEALVVGFATLVAKDLADVTERQALTAGGVVAALCVVAAALLRSRVGFALGWLVQVLLIAAALWVPVMLVIGLGFAVLWTVVLVQGSKADALTLQRERAARQRPRDD